MENKGKARKRIGTLLIILYIAAGILVITGGVILYREFVPYSDLALMFTHKDMSGLISEEDYIKDHPEETAVSSDGTTPVYTETELIPVRFHFIDRGVECDILPVSVGEDGYMGTVNDANAAAWLSHEPYAVPGEVGNAILAGHNIWKGEAGIFSLLKKAEIGEIVAVTFNKGFTRYFEVTDKKENVRYDDKAPMQTIGVDEPILTLITCQGDWDSDIGSSTHRIVVVCKPVKASDIHK